MDDDWGLNDLEKIGIDTSTRQINKENISSSQ